MDGKVGVCGGPARSFVSLPPFSHHNSRSMALFQNRGVSSAASGVRKKSFFVLKWENEMGFWGCEGAQRSSHARRTLALALSALH